MNPDEKEKIDPALRKIMEIPDDQELPDDALIDVMLRALESQQLLIRSSAVHQLVDLGRRVPAMALPKILKALDPEVDYWTVRFGAVEALGEIANKETVKPLIKFLKEDDDPDFRAMVAKQLGEMGDIAKEAGSALIESLSDNESSDLRENAAHAIGLISIKQAVPQLISTLESETDSYAKREMCWALGELNNSTALTCLVAKLEDSDTETRANAAEAIGKLDTTEGIIPVLKSTKDREVVVQAKAIEALKKYSSKDVIKEIEKTADKDIFAALQFFEDYLFNVENEEVAQKVDKIKEPIISAYKEKMDKIKTDLQSCKIFVEEKFGILPSLNKKKLNKFIKNELPPIEAKIANISLYEFRKKKWIENDLFFEIEEITRLYNESGLMLSELRDNVQNLIEKPEEIE
jgi:HEAT repeat protein